MRHECFSYHAYCMPRVGGCNVGWRAWIGRNVASGYGSCTLLCQTDDGQWFRPCSSWGSCALNDLYPAQYCIGSSLGLAKFPIHIQILKFCNLARRFALAIRLIAPSIPCIWERHCCLVAARLFAGPIEEGHSRVRLVCRTNLLLSQSARWELPPDIYLCILLDPCLEAV